MQLPPTTYWLQASSCDSSYACATPLLKMGTIFQDFSPLNSLHFSLDETKIDIDLSLCSLEIKLPTFILATFRFFSSLCVFLIPYPNPGFNYDLNLKIWFLFFHISCFDVSFYVACQWKYERQSLWKREAKIEIREETDSFIGSQKWGNRVARVLRS